MPAMVAPSIAPIVVIDSCSKPLVWVGRPTKLGKPNPRIGVLTLVSSHQISGRYCPRALKSNSRLSRSRAVFLKSLSLNGSGRLGISSTRSIASCVVGARAGAGAGDAYAAAAKQRLASRTASEMSDLEFFIIDRRARSRPGDSDLQPPMLARLEPNRVPAGGQRNLL